MWEEIGEAVNGEHDQDALHKNILKRTIRNANRDKSNPLKILAGLVGHSQAA